jgi:acyl-CoA thioester hydrolase
MRSWSAPVRYAECDGQGVVFNSHYLLYSDEALTGLLRALGTPYEALLARGLDTAVVASELTWVAPARYGDVVHVDAEVERVGRTSFTVAFSIGVEGQPCCRVRTSYVLTDLDRTPTAVPDDLRQAWLSGTGAQLTDGAAPAGSPSR